MNVTVTEKGDILLNGDLVGVIEWHGNTIQSIHVEESEQNNGIGYTAVKEVCERILEDHETVKTTTVTSPAMQRSILPKLGFERKDTENHYLLTNGLQ